MANRRSNRPWSTWLTTMLTVAISIGLTGSLLFIPPPAQAVHDDVSPILNAPFEIDGNAVKESALEDWDSVLAPIVNGVPNPPANSGATFIDDRNNSGTSETSAFFGSNKDIHEINTWERKTSGVSPDKDNITNAYAKAFSVDHDDNPATAKHLFIYFGADRFANEGDAALGFWFFKNDVTVAASGAKSSFSGTHTNDDVLVQVDFVNGGSKSEVQIFRWQSDGNGSHGFLNEIAFASSSGFVVCTPNDTACAITNQGDNTVSPWTYIPKGSNVDSNFPHESFYEGAIDVTALIGEVCFSTFMAETRSSHSETAELKDYAIGDFNLCDITVAKQCKTGTTPVIDSTGTFLTTTLEVTVTNSGFGPVYNTAFEEDIQIPDADTGVLACRLVSPVADNDLDQNELKEILAGELGPGQSVTATLECDHTKNRVFNNVTARSAASPGGTRDITDSYSMAAEDTCEPLITTAIDVTKTCKTVTLVQVNGTLQPRVCNTITLTNTSSEKLVKISLIDDPANAASTTLITNGELAPGASITPIDHCYTPTATDSGTVEPEEATFSNEVLATAEGALTKTAVDDNDNVQCKLCPPPQSEE